MLTARDIPLAIRLPEAVLVRAELPAELGDLLAAVAEMLADGGLRCVERHPVLGHQVGIETAGVRGVEWDLRAVDPGTGREALMRHALGDMAGRIDTAEVVRRERDAERFREIERDLWP